MVIDVMDAYDSGDAKEANLIRKEAPNPIILHGMSNGVGQMVQEVINKTGSWGQITLLRFHGHGAPGSMNIAAGQEDFDEHLSGIANSNIGDEKTKIGPARGPLSKLKKYFAHGARVEMHGCEVAKGPQGEALLKKLSKIWGVPVSASTQNQEAGIRGLQFSFEGPVHTAMPNGVMMSDIPY